MNEHSPKLDPSEFWQFDAFSQHGIFVTDDQLVISYWNTWLETHSEQPSSSMIGRHLFHLFPHLVERKMNRFYQSALEGQASVLSHKLHRYLLPITVNVGSTAATRMQQSCRIAPLVREGQIVGTVTSIEDVTERAIRESSLLTSQAQLAHSRQMLRLVLNTIPVRVFWKDSNSVYQGCNQAFALDAGLSSPESIVGMDDSRLPWSSHAQAYRADDQSVVRSGVARLNYEEPQPSPGGRLNWIKASKVPLRDASGSIIGLLGTYENITASKLAQQEREKLTALVDSSSDFISMTSLDGIPFYLNKSGRLLVGLDPAHDLSALPITAFHDGETEQLLHRTALPQTLASGGWAGEGSLRHFITKALVPVHIHTILVRDPQTHQPICLATVQRNITELRESQKKLAAANRNLVTVARVAGMAEIATNILHSVGNVLNSLNISAERIAAQVKQLNPPSFTNVSGLLRDHAQDLPAFFTQDPVGKRVPDYLAALFEHLSHPQQELLPELASLRKHIDHIREIVRMQQNYARVGRPLEECNLHDILEEAVGLALPKSTRERLQLVREFSPMPSILLDRHMILQILVNLLQNALQAIHAAHPPKPKLTLRIETTNRSTARISIADNGIGIATENLARLFQHGFTTRNEGHGFGLHSGALAAKELGGSLTVHSDGPGHGALFILEFPFPKT